MGWQLESQAAEAGTLGVQLRLGELFRLVLDPATGAGSLSLVEAREAPRLGPDWWALALRLMGAAPGALPHHFLHSWFILFCKRITCDDVYEWRFLSNAAWHLSTALSAVR